MLTSKSNAATHFEMRVLSGLLADNFSTEGGSRRAGNLQNLPPAESFMYSCGLRLIRRELETLVGRRNLGDLCSDLHM